MESEVAVAHEARVAYYEWVRARLQVVIARRQLTQVRATLVQVRALADAQRLSKADRLRVESAEAQTEQIVDQLQSLATLREEQLRLLIGASAGERLSIGEDVREVLVRSDGKLAPEVRSDGKLAPEHASLEELTALAAKQRLSFRALDTGIAAKEMQRDAEVAARYPKLSAFATVDVARPNQRIFPQVDEFRTTWVAGLQLAWTLNDSLITRTNTRRFDAEARELRADRENLERGTRIQVLAAQQALELARRAIDTSQKSLDAAEESYRVRQALLGAERATAVELVDSETELTRARVAALNARIDLRVANAQLAHAVGSDAK
jgi:outer membrane protein TolC